jgi:hypothetical protein
VAARRTADVGRASGPRAAMDVTVPRRRECAGLRCSVCAAAPSLPRSESRRPKAQRPLTYMALLPSSLDGRSAPTVGAMYDRP